MPWATLTLPVVVFRVIPAELLTKLQAGVAEVAASPLAMFIYPHIRHNRAAGARTNRARIGGGRMLP